MPLADASDVKLDDPCLLFAMRRESKAFLREFRPQQRFPGAPGWARFCGPSWLSVLVLETGIGPERMEKALHWLFAPPSLDHVTYRPKLVLSVGFSAALQENMRAGDIVVATEVVDETGNTWPTAWPGELEGDWKPRPHRGRELCVSRVISDPQEKRVLGQRHQALALDMESAIVAHWCRRKNVPFGCIRSISDDIDTPLPAELVSVLAAGHSSPWKVAWTVLRSPSLTPTFWRLAKTTRHASRQLGAALGELLTLTLPFGKEL